MYRGSVKRAKTPLELAALATCAVPGFQIVALCAPQFSDEVSSVTGVIDARGDKWTVTCPHDSVGGLDLDAESGVLARLAKARDARKLPFDVPRIHGMTFTPQGDRVLVHQNLGGRTMTEEDFDDPHILPSSLGKSLAALHNLPPSTYTGVDLPAYSATECRDRHYALLDEAAANVLIPANLWNRWDAALEEISLWRFAPAPIHGDLQGNSLVLDHSVVRAMTGFSSAHVGDPAQDIAWILAQGCEAFFDRFREAYSQERSVVDLHLFTRAQLLSELAIIRWLVHGLHAEDSSIIEDARDMLTDLSQDLGEDELVARRSYSPSAKVESTVQDTEEKDGIDPHSAPTQPLSMSEHPQAVEDEEGA